MPHFCASVSKACQLIRCRASVFFIRGFHTLLSLGVPIVLFVKHSYLHASFSGSLSPVYGICYLILLLFSLSMYYAACLADPGYVPVNTPSVFRDEEEEECDGENSAEHRAMLKQDSGTNRYCEYCEIEQPMRARHCEDCKRCVQKYDHHCPWLETCVGEKNHKFFWMFLMSKACLILWSAVITWYAIEHKDNWKDWATTNILLIASMFILVFGGLTVISLFSFHTYLMCTNSTTWEAVARSRISYLKNLGEDYNPFHMGYCRNMTTFLCKCSAQKWNELYRKSTAKFKADSESVSLTL